MLSVVDDWWRFSLLINLDIYLDRYLDGILFHYLLYMKSLRRACEERWNWSRLYSYSLPIWIGLFEWHKQDVAKLKQIQSAIFRRSFFNIYKNWHLMDVYEWICIWFTTSWFDLAVLQLSSEGRSGVRTVKLDANYDTNSNCYSTKTEIKKMNHATDFLCGRRGGGAVMSLIGHSVKEIEVIVDTFSCSGQSRV